MLFRIKTFALVGSSFFAPLAYMDFERTSRRADLRLQREVYSKSPVRLLPDQLCNGCAGYSSGTSLHLNFDENCIVKGLGTKIDLQLCVGGTLAITDGFTTPEELQSIDVDALALRWDFMSVGVGGKSGNMQGTPEDLPITDDLTSFSLLDFLERVNLDKLLSLETKYEPHIGAYFLHIFDVTDRQTWKKTFSDCFAEPYFVPNRQTSVDERYAVVKRTEEFLYIIGKLMEAHMPPGDLKKFVFKQFAAKAKELREDKALLRFMAKPRKLE